VKPSRLLAFVAFPIGRIALCAPLLLSGTVGGAIFGASELSACLLTLSQTASTAQRQRLDTSWRGLSVGLAYLTPLALRPTANLSSQAALTALVFLVCSQLALRLYMGRSISVSSPTFVKLLTKGPYEIIRHPLASAEIFQNVTFCLCFISARNWCLLPVVIGSQVWAVMVEERFLLGISADYRDYTQRVHARFIPCVA